jgi:hypothetical protein
MLTSVIEAAGGTDNGADDKTSGTCGGDAVRVLPDPHKRRSFRLRRDPDQAVFRRRLDLIVLTPLGRASTAAMCNLFRGSSGLVGGLWHVQAGPEAATGAAVESGYDVVWTRSSNTDLSTHSANGQCGAVAPPHSASGEWRLMGCAGCFPTRVSLSGRARSQEKQDAPEAT